MTGPTPISAPNRLTFQYTSSFQPHVCRNFCEAIASGTPSGYVLASRSGFSPPDIQDAADAFFTAIAPFFNTVWASFGGWVLERMVAGAWQFVASAPTTVAPSGGGSPTFAVGWCVSGKSADNRNFPAYIYEGNFRLIDKAASYGSLNTAEKLVNDYFLNPGGVALDTFAYNWRESRGRWKSDRWLASVWDSNQKLRRRRRIA